MPPKVRPVMPSEITPASVPVHHEAASRKRLKPAQKAAAYQASIPGVFKAPRTARAAAARNVRKEEDRLRESRRLWDEHLAAEEWKKAPPFQLFAAPVPPSAAQRTEAKRLQDLYCTGGPAAADADALDTMRNAMKSHLRITEPFKTYGYDITQGDACALLDGYLFKEECDGGVCCQEVVTEPDGSTHRCPKKAGFLSKDRTQTLFKIMDAPRGVLFRKLEAMAPSVIKQIEDGARATVLNNHCCFFCMEHAAKHAFRFGTQAVEYATFLSSPLYYYTHINEVFSVFFEDVHCESHWGGMSLYPQCTFGNMRPLDQIFVNSLLLDQQNRGLLAGGVKGLIIRAMVFAYNKMREPMLKYLRTAFADAEAVLETILVKCAQILVVLDGMASAASRATSIPGSVAAALGTA